jgi:DnaK suppressor protein
MTYGSMRQRPEDRGHLDPGIELDLFQVRERLLELKAQLEYGDPYAEGHIDPTSGEQVVAFAVQYANEQKLSQVLAALVRIEVGSYGTCVDCVQPINRARLEARPFAVRCVACQQLADRQGNGRDAGSLPAPRRMSD